jgi:hypothetical protein
VAKAAPVAKASPKKPGTVYVSATYRGKKLSATVRVNGVNKGTTPVTVTLPPGAYTFKLEKAGLTPEKRPDVRVVSGKRTNLSFNLK